MKRVPLILSILLCACHAQAQSTYTEKLRKTEAGKGKIVIHQSAEIEKVVNHGNAPAAKKTATPSHNDATQTHHKTDDPNSTYRTEHATAGATHTKRARHKARGYRISIFTGGNSRKDKALAVEMGEKCRKRFPELSVYPNFIPPRWVTYVGDFKTREEAAKYASQIHRAGFTYETRIVSSEVNIPY